MKLTQLGIIACSGTDAASFLQGQISCNINEVSTSQARLGCYCDHKGLVQASFRIIQFEEAFLLITPIATLDHFLHELKKFAAFSNVRLEDKCSDWDIVGLTQDNHGPLLSNFTAASVPKENNQIVAVANAMIIKIINKPARFIMLMKANGSKKYWRAIQEEFENQPATYWDLLDIEDGIAHVSAETLGLFTPHDLNYPAIGGVSFSKGCYRGQEIIARMHYRAKLKSHLARATVATGQVLSAGNKLYDAQQNPVGTIINVAKDEGGAHETGAQQLQQLLVLVKGTAKASNDVYLAKDATGQLQFLALPKFKEA